MNDRWTGAPDIEQDGDPLETAEWTDALWPWSSAAARCVRAPWWTAWPRSHAAAPSR